MAYRATKYLKLVAASMEQVSPQARQISVTLDTDPATSHRIWVPTAQYWNDGRGNLYAAQWIIERENKKLRRQGKAGAIRTESGVHL